MRIDDLLTGSARRFATKPAVVAGRVRYSYADLDLHVSRLAAVFAQRDVGAGDRVVLFMDASYAAVVTLFAVARAGATLLPLDARATGETLRREIARAPSAAIVTEARLAGATADAIAEAGALRLVILSGADRATCSQSCLSFESLVSGLGPAVAPVGAGDAPAVTLVAHPDNQLLSHHDLAAMGAAEDVGEDSLIPVSSSLGFRAGLAAVVGTIATGATLVVESAIALPTLRLRNPEVEAFRLALVG